jgi:hypothetical protein
VNLCVIWRFLLGACQIIYSSEREVKESGMVMIKMLWAIFKNSRARVARGV